MVNFKDHAEASVDPAHWTKEKEIERLNKIAEDTCLKKVDDKDVHYPDHYNWIEGHECNEITKHFSFNAGNAIQYLYRHLHKGTAVKDLKKAMWYIESEIARLEEE